MKMSKTTREIYYDCFNGDITKMMNFLNILETSYDRNTIKNQKRIALITATYCERFKQKAKVEVIDITFTDEYDIRIIVKIVDDKRNKVIITDIIDNIELPCMYINNTTSYASIILREECIAHSLFYSNQKYCQYYTFIIDAIHHFIKEHFSYVSDVVQLVSNKRYVKLIGGN